MSRIRRGLRSLATLGVHKLRDRSRRHDVTGRPPHLERHEGATERFGAELRAMRHMEVSPELISDIESELQWGLVWHEFERTMQAEIGRVFAPYLTIADCVDFNDLRDLVGLAEPVPA
jgi:hypothetical protein